MQQQKGFTLIELIIVIVILGILAVTAAPKFLDIQGDAKASTIKAVTGAINSSNSIIYGKALIQGKSGESDTITVGSSATETALVWGYPSAAVDLTSLLDVDSEMDADFQNATATAIANTSAINFYGITPDDYEVTTLETSGCTITYLQAADATTPPVITTYTVGCN